MTFDNSTAWMNWKSIILNERHFSKKLHTGWVHTIILDENLEEKFMGTQNRSILPGASVWQNVFTIKDHQETLLGGLYKYFIF